MERLGQLGAGQSSLAPRIAALLRLPAEGGGEEEDEEEEVARLYFVEEEEEEEEGGHGRGAVVPLLNWGWWRKRRFLSVEDEESAAHSAALRERKSEAWVEAYFREFAHAARHVKRAALLLRRRLVHAQQPPTGTGTSNGRPAGSQRSWSSALLLPRLRWLRPSDPVHLPTTITHHPSRVGAGTLLLRLPPPSRLATVG
jgi:hypothetical protein